MSIQIKKAFYTKSFLFKSFFKFFSSYDLTYYWNTTQGVIPIFEESFN